MAHDAEALPATVLPAGEGFLDGLAREICLRHAREIDAGDLSSIVILVPALALAADLRAALMRAASRPLLLPHFATLREWIESAAGSEIADAAPDSQRLVLLHEALRRRGWFDETALWGIAAEIAQLFDELSEAALALPADEGALALQMEHAYGLRASTPLAFEARVVHELWRALSASGALDAAAVYRMRLAAVLRKAPAVDLIVVLPAAPQAALMPAEIEFLRAFAEAQSVAVCHPLARAAGAAAPEASPLLATLAAAWPELPASSGSFATSATSATSASSELAPLIERAGKLARQLPQSPLAGRLQLVAADGREQEAQAAVAQVGQWLAAGLRRIVLIAQDRLSARRIRALLEREQVLVSDETGWTLSTSRAAAAIDALLETIESGAYYRDFVDLCKSPFVFADGEEGKDGERKSAVFAIESALRAASVKAGLTRIRSAFSAADCDPATLAQGLALIDRVEAAVGALRSPAAPLARWLARLQQALASLGASQALESDAAGRVILDLIEARRAELDGVPNPPLFSFASWRDWLNREFEAATFRDGSIASSIVLTSLKAVRLRPFEAAILIGGDARELAPASGGAFFNSAVRRELGLKTREDGERELRHDLELLLAGLPRVVVTWQAKIDGEANLLAPDLALLSTLHALAWNEDLQALPLSARAPARADPATAPLRTQRAAPVVPPGHLPQRVSVSAYASLVACPYRFFASQVLGLGEIDEVAEEMDKSDYGALVHRVLERFHERHALILSLSHEFALAELVRCSDEVFAPAIADNFLATGWRLRWQKRLAAYLDWQRAREAEGWRWLRAEARFERRLELANGGEIEFYGRIDRIDRRLASENADAGQQALLDYKTQSAKLIGERLRDDIQLPSYALLHGDAEEAAYVALDDERVLAIASEASGAGASSLADQAQAQGERLRAAFTAMHSGAALPAHGVASVCKWCAMRGLCRRDHV